MVNTGVVYSLHGNYYWPQICVSIWSLRRHYKGPICIAALDTAGYRLACELADSALAQPLIVICPHLDINRRNGGYAAKSQLIPLVPFELGVFLDADTVVAGPFFEDLLPTGVEEVVLTQFANWKTTGKRISGRVKKWEQFAPTSVAQCLAAPWPAVNTGVYGFRRESAYFQKDWGEMTERNISFICDEIAAQLLVPTYAPGGRMRVMPDAYNRSPVYNPSYNNVRIWHFHGGKHLRPGLPKQIWWEAYLNTRKADLGGITKWAADIEPLLKV